jgi:hypothetical protein
MKEDRYEPIKEMTKEDCREIYRLAIERSKEILMEEDEMKEPITEIKVYKREGEPKCICGRALIRTNGEWWQKGIAMICPDFNTDGGHTFIPESIDDLIIENGKFKLISEPDEDLKEIWDEVGKRMYIDWRDEDNFSRLKDCISSFRHKKVKGNELAESIVACIEDIREAQND